MPCLQQWGNKMSGCHRRFGDFEIRRSFLFFMKTSWRPHSLGISKGALDLCTLEKQMSSLTYAFLHYRDYNYHLSYLLKTVQNHYRCFLFYASDIYLSYLNCIINFLYLKIIFKNRADAINLHYGDIHCPYSTTFSTSWKYNHYSTFL